MSASDVDIMFGLQCHLLIGRQLAMPVFIIKL